METIEKNIEPVVYTIDELAQVLRIGKTKAYELSDLKDFPVKKVGRRKLVSKAGLEQWLLKNNTF
ncbi:helix-turn-helix domain-containing protein [Tyzzerella sp. OttesenSCG-928-J15]|nr:helix-turn-helix domain-containing protein [Tyzzerella sp. OttesenSCG-928-J15]